MSKTKTSKQKEKDELKNVQEQFSDQDQPKNNKLEFEVRINRIVNADKVRAIASVNFNKCFAFEPSINTRYLMYANIASHDKIDKIIPLSYAISDNPGTRGFTGWSENIENGSSRTETGNADVEYRTLDSFGFNNVGLIKVDIEGYEYNALHSGLKTLIQNDFPPLLVEMWSDSSIDSFWSDENTRNFYKNQERKLYNFLTSLDYVQIKDKDLCDWMTYFFIHKTHIHNFNGNYNHPEL